jgi:hypothetical protein
LLADAVADKFDTALILSGDSDIAPVITKLKELCPGKKIGKGPVRVLIVPQNHSAMNLKQYADFFKKIQDRDLKKSLLSEQITYNGMVIPTPAGLAAQTETGYDRKGHEPLKVYFFRRFWFILLPSYPTFPFARLVIYSR